MNIFTNPLTSKLKLWLLIGGLGLVIIGGTIGYILYNNSQDRLEKSAERRGELAQANRSLEQTISNVETANEIEREASNPASGILLAECLRSASVNTRPNCERLLPDNKANKP